MKYDLIICQQTAKNIVFYFSQRPEAPHGSTDRSGKQEDLLPPLLQFRRILVRSQRPSYRKEQMAQDRCIRVDQEEQRIIRKQLYTQLY